MVTGRVKPFLTDAGGRDQALVLVKTKGARGNVEFLRQIGNGVLLCQSRSSGGINDFLII